MGRSEGAPPTTTKSMCNLCASLGNRERSHGRWKTNLGTEHGDRRRRESKRGLLGLVRRSVWDRGADTFSVNLSLRLGRPWTLCTETRTHCPHAHSFKHTLTQTHTHTHPSSSRTRKSCFGPCASLILPSEPERGCCYVRYEGHWSPAAKVSTNHLIILALVF